MNRRRISFALCLLALLTVGIVYVRSRAQSTASLKQQLHSRQNIRPQDIYEEMFRSYGALQKKAQAAGLDTPTGNALRTLYKRQAKLTDAQSSQLDAITANCLSELEALDTRAKQVIDEARARVPGGRLKQGEAPPPAPPELDKLQERREAKVLQAREQLRASFGEAEFARFDEFVERTIAANMKSTAPGDRHLQMRPLQQREQPTHP